MKKIFANELENLDFFFLRTPVLPFNLLKKILPEQDLVDLTYKWWGEPMVKEAIWIASSRLYHLLDAFFADAFSPKKKLDKSAYKLLLTFLRYNLRMSTRCTPFGLFAGLSMGKIDSTTQLSLHRENKSRNVRPDMGHLNKIMEWVMIDESLRRQLDYGINNSSYLFGNKIRFLSRQIKEGEYRFFIETQEASKCLTRILDHLESKNIKLEKLIPILEEEGYIEKEAWDFLDTLIEKQVLLPVLLPGENSLSYWENLTTFFKKNTSNKLAQKCLKYLQKTKGLSIGIREVNSTQALKAYFRWESEMIQDEMPSVEYASKRLQIDLYKKLAENRIKPKVVEELKKSVNILAHLPLKQKSFHLENFKKKFRQRYGTKEVSLAELMDQDLGIGYPIGNFLPDQSEKIIDDFSFKNSGSQHSNPEFGTTPAHKAWDDFLLGKYLTCLKKKQATLELSSSELQPFLSDSGLDWSDTVYMTCSILAASVEALDRQEFKVVHLNSGGGSAARLLSRFYDLDKAVKKRVEEIIRIEELEEDSIIAAEILHTPLAHLGNVSGQQNLRPFTICLFDPYPSKQSLPISDLMVSIKEGAVLLRSKKWNKQVKPYLTSAINPYYRSIPHFKFLGDLATQGIHLHLAWDWGRLKTVDFLPRVTYGKTILAKARWQIKASEFSADVLKNKKVFEEELAQLQKDKTIPDWIILQEKSQKLPLSLKSSSCKQILWEQLKKSKDFILEECLYRADNLFLLDENKNQYTNEFVFPFKVQKKNNVIQGKTLINTKLDVKRNFNPGSNWLSFNLYCGVKPADDFLRNTLAEIVEEMRDLQYVDHWFFLRYPSPFHHLRLRFYHHAGQDSAKLIYTLMSKLNRPDFWKVQVDQYSREIERYGGENIENMEQLFFYDSEAVIEVLSNFRDDMKMPRWMIGIVGTHLLMEDFGINLDQKVSLMNFLRDKFAWEFSTSLKANNKKLNAKLLPFRNEIDELIRDPLGKLDAPLKNSFLKRSKRNKEVILRIKELDQKGDIPMSLEHLCGTCIHLFLNRLLVANQRHYEAVIYDFMYKRYFSQTRR